MSPRPHLDAQQRLAALAAAGVAVLGLVTAVTWQVPDAPTGTVRTPVRLALVRPAPAEVEPAGASPSTPDTLAVDVTAPTTGRAPSTPPTPAQRGATDRVAPTVETDRAAAPTTDTAATAPPPREAPADDDEPQEPEGDGPADPLTAAITDVTTDPGGTVDALPPGEGGEDDEDESADEDQTTAADDAVLDELPGVEPGVDLEDLDVTVEAPVTDGGVLDTVVGGLLGR